MVDVVTLVYRLAGALRIICAGFQVADALTGLAEAVKRCDALSLNDERETLTGEGFDYAAESEFARRNTAGGV